MRFNARLPSTLHESQAQELRLLSSGAPASGRSWGSVRRLLCR